MDVETDVSSGTRFRIAVRLVADYTYAEIADDLGVSEYKVAAVANWYEDEAAATTPEEAVLRDVIAGGAGMMVDNYLSSSDGA